MKYKHLTTTLIITLIVAVLFSCKYFTYATTYENTINQVALSGHLTRDFIKDNAKQVSDTAFLINDLVLETFDKRQENIEKILELQFERQQSEQSLLEIWTALITIVFLVFSFYSFFHTDELVKRAKEDADKIKDKLNVSDQIKKEFQEQLQKIYDPIKEDLESGKEIIAKAHKIEKYDYRLTKVEDWETEQQKHANDIAELQESIKKLQKIVQDLQSEDAANEEEGSNS